MAWGDKGTLFVGTFDLGNVYAIVDRGGTKEVKTVITGLKMPTGLAFRDGTLYVEKAITPARHVEIQVMCDNFDNVLTCGERECSIQRRHQKLIEESPSPALDAERREAWWRAIKVFDEQHACMWPLLLIYVDGVLPAQAADLRVQVEFDAVEQAFRERGWRAPNQWELNFRTRAYRRSRTNPR